MRYLIFLLIVSSISFGGNLAPELQAILDTLSPSMKTPVTTHLTEQGDLSIFPEGTPREEKIVYLKSIAEKTQAPILTYLNSEGNNVENIKSFWLTNCIAFSATADVIITIAQREDIDYVIDDYIVHLDVEPGEDMPDPEWNIQKVEATTCWTFGYTGAGILVGNLDSGVEVDHPALQGKWRSTNGWFDAVNGQSSPYDDHVDSHGTHTMGIICGGDGPGPFEHDIGVAPGVSFICAKVLDSEGNGQTSWIRAGFNWVAGLSEPPDVLSNSWRDYARNSTEFWGDCLNLKNLGIILVFAIGNEGSAPGTSFPPGSFPIVIGTGATYSNDDIRETSSRGSAPDEPNWRNSSYWPRLDWDRINPAISAPGVNINSSVRGGDYAPHSGTSMACPHVAGCVALMLQKNHNLGYNLVFNLITDNADHPSQGGSYPNNDYGWGRLNCFRALRLTPGPSNPNFQVDNLIKNWWKPASAYIGNNQYSTGREQYEYQYTDPVNLIPITFLTLRYIISKLKTMA